ncbi:MAG TPA: N-acetylornithine carbamoyltransferase [Planctomycetota bacterium]
MNGLYHLGELAGGEVEALAARALALRAGAPARRFEGLALGLLFLNPSLRTQASFQRAAGRLGFDLVQLAGGAQGVWGLETRDGQVMDGAAAEHVREAAGVLGRYVDLLAVRAFAGSRDLAEDLRDPVLQGFRTHAGVPVVNMESALWHPCQALADRVTLEQHAVPAPTRFVLTWAWHPKPLPHAVPNSTLCMAAQRGMECVVLRPPGFALHADALAEAHRLAAASGGSVRESEDRAEALAGATVVYAKSWGSLAHWGDADAEARHRAPLRDWCVGSDWMARAAPGARFLHCLPVRRNVVVSDAVLDGPASVVLDQAENRLHAQTALLERLAVAVTARPAATAAKAAAAMESPA